MKKLYIIISSWGQYGDTYKKNECVCNSLYFAEKKKIELENKYRELLPFPFDWITEEEFNELADEGQLNLIEEDENIYNKWYDWNMKVKDFNECFIKEVDYFDN